MDAGAGRGKKLKPDDQKKDQQPGDRDVQDVPDDLNPDSWEVIEPGAAGDRTAAAQEGSIQDAAKENTGVVQQEQTQSQSETNAGGDGSGNNETADEETQDRNQAVEYNPETHHNEPADDDIEEIDKNTLELYAKVSQAKHGDKAEPKIAEDDFFDRPDDTPEEASLPKDAQNRDKRQHMLDFVKNRRKSDIYKAVCVARLLNSNQPNPVAHAAPVSKKDQAKYWGWNAWDTIVDTSNIVSGVDSLYGNFFSEGKKTKKQYFRCHKRDRVYQRSRKAGPEKLACH